jgi:hypothetical protein
LGIGLGFSRIPALLVFGRFFRGHDQNEYAQGLFSGLFVKLSEQ